MALNNEVSILNIANIDNDIKDASTRGMIAGEEKTAYATHNYDVNEYFIWNDRKLYKTLTPITTGNAFVVNTNIKYIGNFASQLYELFAQSPDSIRANISNVEETGYASRAYSVGETILRPDGFLYRVKVAVSTGTAWNVGTNIELTNNLSSQIYGLQTKANNKVLFLTSVACSATTGNFASVSNSAITADHVVVECSFASPSAITSDVTWTTGNGTLTLNGTCTTATTATITLAKKDN